MEQQQQDDFVDSPCPTTTYPDDDDRLVDTVPIEGSKDWTSYDYEGVNIQFPYEAYPCQEHLMEAIINGVNEGKNCILESPTGTGKTAALLCSLLAWQQQQDSKHQSSPSKKIKPNETQNEEQEPSLVPIIYYATRTLKHIDQIIDQLAVTSYYDTPMAILTSMKHTCNNESNAPLRAPRPPSNVDTDEHYCQRNSAVLQWCQNLKGKENKTWKISELQDFCQKRKTCPYFEMLRAKDDARVIFCTYAYLLKSDVQQALELTLKNNIVVFDEGHNVEDICYQIASTPEGFLTYKNLSKFATILGSGLNCEMPADKRTALQTLSGALERFGNVLSARYYYKRGALRRDFSNPKKMSFQEFHDLLPLDFRPRKITELRESYNFLKNPYATETNVGRFNVSREALRFVADLLRVLDLFWESYKAYGNEPELAEFSIFLERTLSTLQTDETVTAMLPLDLSIDIRIICLSPAVVFKQMEVTRSVIVASGTLGPLKQFSSQLGIPFKHERSECHTVKPERVFCKLINKYEGSSAALLELKYENIRNDSKWKDIQDQLANIVIQICRNVPKGVVVFLQSEAFATKLQEAWKKNGHWKTLEGLKNISVERKGMRPEEVKTMLDTYREHAENRGAILLAYMRGKFSEGIDFKGDHARALVTVGIPFLPINDLFIAQKRAYQNKKCPNKNVVKSTRGSDWPSGIEWYATNAFRALNQAIGRNIRHMNDWGAIFMVDSRWCKVYNQDRLPNWIKVNLKKIPKGEEKAKPVLPLPFKEVLTELAGFVEEMNMKND